MKIAEHSDRDSFDSTVNSNGFNPKTFWKVESQGAGALRTLIVFCAAAEEITKPLADFIESFVEYCIDKNSAHNNLAFRKDNSKHYTKEKTEFSGDGRVVVQDVIRRTLGDELRLELPSSTAGNINYFGARFIEKPLGREQEQQALRSFLHSPAPFAWLQIAGVAGQGKSRLALELAIEAKDKGWNAGTPTLTAEVKTQEYWENWKPNRPHLIVFDYVLGQIGHIREILNTLCSRRENDFSNKVRILLVERQRWDQGGILRRHRPEVGSIHPDEERNGYADWFHRLVIGVDGNDRRILSCKFEEGIVELDRLEPAHLVTIAKRVALKYSEKISISDEEIRDRLKRIDYSGRPLYAYFLGQAMSDGKIPEDWTREDLLNSVIQREYQKRWSAICPGDSTPTLAEDTLALRIAVLATITKGIDCQKAAREGIFPEPELPERKQALVITDSFIGSGPFYSAQTIQPLQPDLLGEWLVLSAFSICLPCAELLDKAWIYHALETGAFLQRLAQDFPAHPMTLTILDHLPSDTVAMNVMTEIASPVITALASSKAEFPKNIIFALEKSANAGSINAIRTLGVSYASGRGVERNLTEALNWFLKGADAGDGRSMAYAGVYYLKGRGTEIDFDKAVHWFNEGAVRENGLAMAYLGYCYSSGKGVDKKPDVAITWYEKGVAAGEGFAMYSLGWCYENGWYVEEDKKRAFQLYRQGGEANDLGAMQSLVRCYREGVGCEKNTPKAEYWGVRSEEARREYATPV